MRVKFFFFASMALCVLRFANADNSYALATLHRDYLTLSKSAEGRTLPVVWRRTVGGRTLVVLGTQHNRNAQSPMYDRIERVLREADPQVIIHESEAPEDLLGMSAAGAITRAADLGFVAYEASLLRASFRSGDAPAREEIAQLRTEHSDRDVFVFLVAQRYIGSSAYPNERTLAEGFPSFVHDRLESFGLPVHEEWKSWRGFCAAFAEMTGQRFSASSWDAEWLNPIHATGPISDMVRASDVVRDRYLVSAIAKELTRHDRVVVVFGFYHVLAIERELDALLPKR